MPATATAILLAAQSAAQAVPPADAPVSAWAPILILVAIAIVFAAGTLGLSSLLSPTRRGPVKDSPYESGVEPAGDVRQPFNVRYYLVAMIFLLFDVEVVLLFPWAVMFGARGGDYRTGAMLAASGVFTLLLVIGLVYDWRRGALRFD